VADNAFILAAQHVKLPSGSEKKNCANRSSTCCANKYLKGKSQEDQVMGRFPSTYENRKRVPKFEIERHKANPAIETYFTRFKFLCNPIL